MSNPITLDITAFREAFPVYANVTAYPDIRLQTMFDLGCGYVSPNVIECGMTEAVQTWALWLMTAHLLWISDQISNGGANNGTPGQVTSSKVGDVAVTLEAPPNGGDSWRYWLNLSPWGQQLLALLSVQGAGGFYVGGMPERHAFRGYAGIYP